MSTPNAKPSSPVRRAAVFLGVFATFGLALVAILATLREPAPDPDPAPEDSALHEVRAQQRSSRFRREDFDVADARRRYQRAQRERGYVDHDPGVAVFSRDEAVASFEGIMDHLDALASRGERVSKKQKAELYRAANDAFAALSNKLDPTNRDDALQLENASITLREQLSRLGIEPVPFMEEAQLPKRPRRRHG